MVPAASIVMPIAKDYETRQLHWLDLKPFLRLASS
jgi:hypothetical protein